MRPLGLMALRALVHARRLEAVCRPALVAAGLGGFSLGDSHFCRDDYSCLAPRAAAGQFLGGAQAPARR